MPMRKKSLNPEATVPQRLLTDGGTEFVSKDARLGSLPASRTGRSPKAAVERFFRAMNSGLVTTWPGSARQSTSRRRRAA